MNEHKLTDYAWAVFDGKRMIIASNRILFLSLASAKKAAEFRGLDRSGLEAYEWDDLLDDGFSFLKVRGVRTGISVRKVEIWP